MPIKAYNPTTPARRGMTSQDLSDITTRKSGSSDSPLLYLRVIQLQVLITPVETVSYRSWFKFAVAMNLYRRL